MPQPFDTLKWEMDLGWWTGVAELAPGHSIDIHVEADNDAALLASAVARAEPAWERLRGTEPSVRAAVAEQMTGTHNDLCDPADEVTPEQFAERLQLLSAKFEASGETELVYFDGMLFGGHHLIVPVAPDGTVGEASEAG